MNEMLELQVHDKVVIEDRFTGQYEEEIYEVNINDDRTMSCYETKNFEISIKYRRIFVHHKALDEDKNIDCDFKIIEAKRPVNVIENGFNKTIDMSFWKDGKYLDIDDLIRDYPNVSFINHEDVYKRKYEDLVYLLSRANKQITLNDRNNVQTLVLDLSCLNPDIKQDLYKLIVKEMK